ncbi:MAG: hypothetical protein M3539_11995 [Acidobacteriota bacterium]|nr:hypothetical protein [Acidobacteriota bacterium]
MRTIHCLVLVLGVTFFAACKQTAMQPAQQLSSPAPLATAAPETKSTHPNQVAVSMGKISSEAAPLNPRIAEAYSPEKVTLLKTVAAPSFYMDTPPAPKVESAPPGMKWLIVIVETGAAQGEVSIPLNKIRLVDPTKKAYRLVSFGAGDAGTYTDFREYDKYKMVEPPKLIMKSPIAGKQDFLFAVAEKAEGLSLEF